MQDNKVAPATQEGTLKQEGTLEQAERDTAPGVGTLSLSLSLSLSLTHTHTHTSVWMCVYISI